MIAPALGLLALFASGNAPSVRLRLERNDKPQGTVCFSPDDRYLLFGAESGAIEYDAETLRQVRKFRATSANLFHHENLPCAKYDPSGEYVLTWSADEPLRCWNRASQTIVWGRSTQNAEPSPWADAQRPEGYFDVAFSSSGREFAVGGNVFGLADGRPTQRAWDHALDPNVAPNGNYRVALAGGNLTLTDKTGRRLSTVAHGLKGEVRTAVAPDSRSVLIWDLAPEVPFPSPQPSSNAPSLARGALIYDVGSNALKPLPGVREVTDVSFAADSSSVAVTSDARTVCVYDLRNLRLKLKVPSIATGSDQASDPSRSHFPPTILGVLSPRGDRLAVASTGGGVETWDVARGAKLVSRTLRRLTRDARIVSWPPNATFSSDGTLLCFSYYGACLVCSDAQVLFDNSSKKEFADETLASVWFAFGNKGRTFASNGQLPLFYDGADTRFVQAQTALNRVAAPSLPSSLAWGSGNGVRIFDTETGRWETFSSELFVAQADQRALSAAEPPDSVKNKILPTVADVSASGRLVSVVGFSLDTLFRLLKGDLMVDGLRAVVFDRESGRRLLQVPSLAFGATISPDDKTIVVASKTSDAGEVEAIACWDIASGKKAWTCPASDFRFSPDGRLIAVESEGVRVLRTSTGEELVRGPGRSAMFGSFTESGRYFFTLGERELSCMDAWTRKASTTEIDEPTLERLKTEDGPPLEIEGCAASPSGEDVFAGTSTGFVVRFRLRGSRRTVETFDAGRNPIMALHVSPGGESIALSRADGRIDLFSSKDGRIGRSLEGAGACAFGVRFTKDARHMATRDLEGRTFVYDLTSAGQDFELYVEPSAGDWYTIGSNGQFDSQTGIEASSCHFVYEAEGGPVVLLPNQIRATDLYVRDLASRIMFDGFRLVAPNVGSGLNPLVQIDRKGGALTFRLLDQGGGIGDVAILVRGLEVLRYPAGRLKDLQTVKFDLKTVRGFQEGMKVDVVAYNADGRIRSRGDETAEDPVPATDSTKKRYVCFLVGGQKYAGELGELFGPQNDVVEMARAFGQMAEALSIAPEIYLFVDDPSSVAPAFAGTNVRVRPCTKQSFEDAEKSIVKPNDPMTSNDLLVLQISGHGTVVDGAYHYLFPGADSADPKLLLTHPERSLSSEDILRFLTLGVASNQLVILDTCQAGAIDVSGIVGRSRSDELDATLLEWSKGARATFMLLGCAKDRSSYENPNRGHGYLTLGALNALKMGRLGEGGSQVQADRFVYEAAAEAQALSSLDGIRQSPLPLAPRGWRPFPLGVLSDRSRILRNYSPKPVFSGIILQDDEHLVWSDVVFSVRRRLSRLGQGAPVAWSENAGLPGAYQLVGIYRKQGGRILLRLQINRNLPNGEQKLVRKLPERTVDADAVPEALYEEIVRFGAENDKPRKPISAIDP